MIDIASKKSGVLKIEDHIFIQNKFDPKKSFEDQFKIFNSERKCFIKKVLKFSPFTSENYAEHLMSMREEKVGREQMEKDAFQK